MIDAIRQAVLAALGRRPTPAQRRAIAEQLDALADEQRRIADAAERQQARPAAERAAPRQVRAGPGRAPADFVRIAWEPRGGREHLRVYVGRALWYALGSPARLDVQRLGGRIEIRSTAGDAGYAVTAGSGMPRFYAAGSQDLLGDLTGRYRAEVRGGAIVVGARIEDSAPLD